MIIQKLITNTNYPCLQDVLADEETNELIATVFIDSETELPVGIWISSEGVYEIVVKGNSVSRETLLQSLTELTQITGVKYEVEFNS